MPTEKEVIKKVGKEMWDKMVATKWLDGITVTMNENGETNIPQSDIDRAYRAAKGEKIHPLNWD